MNYNMSNFNTYTNTATYTVVDIRRTFEGFDADLRMISRRTGKWEISHVEHIIHDILKLAEAKYLKEINIILERDVTDDIIRAVKYSVNADGKAQSTQRPGENDWTNVAGTHLSIVIEYQSSWKALTEEQKTQFRSDHGFKISWGPSNIDTSFRHLSSQSGQLYASNGYELQKKNYK